MGDIPETPSLWNLLSETAALGRPNQRGLAATPQLAKSCPCRPKRWTAARIAARLTTVCSSENLSRFGRKQPMAGGPGFFLSPSMASGEAFTTPNAWRQQLHDSPVPDGALLAEFAV